MVVGGQKPRAGGVVGEGGQGRQAVETDQRAVIARVREVLDGAQGTPGGPAVVGRSGKAARRTAAVQQDPAVLEGGNLVFVGGVAVRPGANELPEGPAVAVVVTVRGGGHDPAAGQDHKLLYQPAAKRAGVDLDTLPRRGEDSGNVRLAGVSRRAEFELGGDPAVLPGQSVVAREAEVAVLDVVIGRNPGHCFEVPGVRSGGVEHEDPAGLHVHQEARIAEPVEASACPHYLLPAPGPAMVRTAAEQEVDRVRQVVEVGAAVVGGQQGALPRDGEGGDPVLAVAAGATHRQYVFDVGLGGRHWLEDMGCHISMVGDA